MSEGFKVKTEHFEGPLDLLLNLIEKSKLSISQVSLSKVADDFMVYIESLNDFPVAESADFILVASTLVLIKSKSLLPSLELTEEESGNIEDLERRLRILEKIKRAARDLQNFSGHSQMYFQNERKITPVFSPHQSIVIPAILAACKTLIMALPKFEKIQKAVVQKVISLEEMIKNLSDRITRSLKMSFRDFTSFGKKEKVSIIVSFLAMLELVKQGAIRVVQDGDFTDISMETEGDVKTPNYS